jgi:hypothetical protein
MVEPTADTQAQIQQLVEEIAGCHHLAADLREELRIHIEDKIQAYLNGEELLTDQDALLLAREHFGNRDRLRGLLGEIHPQLVACDLKQRLAPAMAATAAAMLGSGLLCNALWTTGQVTYYEGAMAGVILFSVICGGILRHWKKRLHAGQPPSMVQWRPARQGALIVGLLLLIQLLQPLYIALWQQGYNRPIVGHETDTLRFVLSFYSWVFICTLLWFWWCDVRNELQALMVLKGLWLFLLLSMLSLFSYSNGQFDTGYSPAVTLFPQNNFRINLMLHFPVSNLPTFLFQFLPTMTLPLAAWAALFAARWTRARLASARSAINAAEA